MTAAEIALALGGAHRSGAWWRCRCRVHDSASATLALRDGDRNLVVFRHAGCSRPDILRELRRRGLTHTNTTTWTSAFFYDTGSPDWRPSATRRTIAKKTWQAAQPAAGSPVEAYLPERGIMIIPPASLRYAPSLRRPDGTCRPAMVACVRNIDGTVVGRHRTWLTREADGCWRRLDRASLGPIGGGAVRLEDDEGVDLLLVSEGIETGLASLQATGVPTWAALSTSGLVRLQLPHSIVKVTILADNDKNGAGERAARAAADRRLDGVPPGVLRN